MAGELMLTNEQLRIIPSQKLPNLKIITVTPVTNGIDILVSNDEYGHYRLFHNGKVRQYDSASQSYVGINNLSKHIEKEIENLYPDTIPMNRELMSLHSETIKYIDSIFESELNYYQAKEKVRIYLVKVAEENNNPDIKVTGMVYFESEWMRPRNMFGIESFEMTKWLEQ